MNRIFFIIILSSFIATSQSQAQTRLHCATVEYSNKLFINGHIGQTDVAFEEWLRAKQRAGVAKSQGREAGTVYRIPVVVHVVHNGEDIGEGANISDEQIVSQIRVLNEDFQRLNADAANTPDEFKSVAGKMNLEFVLAKRDPNGLPTTGIVRVNGGKSQWKIDDNSVLKSKSYWPAEDYFNIWVCNLSGYLGYSQFPVSDLAGLENSPNNRLTDGVVIWYKSFGSADDGDFDLDAEYNKGRTATHEIGHCFGLRHIWGDSDDCTGTDYVDDTPKQQKETSGCPTHPYRTCTPSVVSMFQNYMDYTDDACMNLFTAGQIARMQTVLENSPRRASLLRSNALILTSPVTNDIGFREIVTPHASQCSNHISPSVKLWNYGTNTVTSARVRVKLNGVLIETKDFVLFLNPADSLTLDFGSLDIANGTSNITFEIALTNGVIDGDDISNNNILTQTVFVPSRTNVPFQQNFVALDQGWFVQNPDELQTWEFIDVPRDAASSGVMTMPFSGYDYQGENDILYSPVFHLDGSAMLYFDIAYSKNTSGNDGLKIIAIGDCSNVDQGTVIYEKNADELETAGVSNGKFIANSAKDWRTEHIDLSAFAGTDNLQLAFVATSGSGNNLFLDNIIVASHLTDIKLNHVVSPSLVSAATTTAKILVQNTGTTILKSVVVNTKINDGKNEVTTVTGLNLLPGAVDTITLAGLAFKTGNNLLEVNLAEPNGEIESYTENNSTEVKIVINDREDVIPLRQNFDNHSTEWIIANPAYGVNFEFFETASANGKSAAMRNFNNTRLGDESWLVSPLLDFSNVAAASMIYDLSYSEVSGGSDRLRVKASTDGGMTYSDIPVGLPSRGVTNSAWEPHDDSDWSKGEYLDLTSLAGNDSVRVAFVVTNASGSNLYLDNIEFFVSEDQRSIEINEGYNIYGYNQHDFTQSALKIGFNLSKRQDVACEIIDVTGRKVGSAHWTNVLNQIFELPVEQIRGTGIYVVRVSVGNHSSASRILVKH